MSRITLASLREQIDALQVKHGALQADHDANKSLLLARKNTIADLNKEVLRLRLVASEMRGFIMAHHAYETPEGGQRLYRETYGGENEDNIVIVPVSKYPFMDVDLQPTD